MEHELLPDDAPCALDKIVSGGQTGVDRAGLDVAIELGIAHGGWCPRGRRAEDGVVPSCYELAETDSPDYAVRTEKNVLDSDGTLILHLGTLKGGTKLTHQLARKHGRPCRVVDLHTPESAEAVCEWIREHHIRVLNVAGPRASQTPDIYRMARAYLQAVTGACRGSR